MKRVLTILMLLLAAACGGSEFDDVVEEQVGPGVEEPAPQWWCLEIVCLDVDELDPCNEDPRDLTFEVGSTHQLGLAYFQCSEEEAQNRSLR